MRQSEARYGEHMRQVAAAAVGERFTQEVMVGIMEDGAQDAYY